MLSIYIIMDIGRNVKSQALNWPFQQYPGCLATDWDKFVAHFACHLCGLRAQQRRFILPGHPSAVGALVGAEDIESLRGSDLACGDLQAGRLDDDADDESSTV